VIRSVIFNGGQTGQRNRRHNNAGQHRYQKESGPPPHSAESGVTRAASDCRKPNQHASQEQDDLQRADNQC
jgi:hypothetical protein